LAGFLIAHFGNSVSGETGWPFLGSGLRIRKSRSWHEIAGETVAQEIQLGIEYDPAPPFNSGHPDTAPDAIKSTLMSRYAQANSALRAGIERATIL
jgi:hypothetical protein